MTTRMTARMTPAGQHRQNAFLLTRRFFSIVLVASSLGLSACSNDSSTSADEVDTDIAQTELDDITTAGVLCDYSKVSFNSDESVNTASDSTWTCNDTERNLAANGIPDHEVGTFPNADNPNTISVQNVSASYTLFPEIISGTGTPSAVSGFALNGVKFDPGTGGTCDDLASCSLDGGDGQWRIEALGQSAFLFGTDDSNAHVQPTGDYHYHGMPEGFVATLNQGTEMTLVGWAIDGFPVYARYGYTDPANSASATKILTGSYQLKSTADEGRPSTELYAMGTFQQDYEYIDGLGDMDECNGRVGVTPEFPEGIYYYAITDSYPFIQRCVKGDGGDSGRPPGPPPGA